VKDILIWSKDPIAVIKSLEKIYISKSVGIPELKHSVIFKFKVSESYHKDLNHTHRKDDFL
jgi:hypothetical protein